MHRVAHRQLERDRGIFVQAADNLDLKGALAQFEFSKIRSGTGAGATAVQTLFRFKTSKLNFWNDVHSHRSCPHGTCPLDILGSFKHVFWKCTITKAAWSDFENRWRRLGDNVPDNLMDLCFNLFLFDTPARAWLAAVIMLMRLAINIEMFCLRCRALSGG